MNNLLLSMILIMILVMLVMTLINFLSKKCIIDMQKSTPFECGFNPISLKRMSFSIHFFLIAVIFLIFDIEIIIIIPMIMTLKSTMLYYWLMTSTMFTLIITAGLIHEWYNGMLNWTE
uniref:NADH-ubiquinone oxidoreductase chain 3 n=1 Tax=Bothrogonia tongmaiana TaxID=1030435 RepID=A0A7D5YLE1_9HEMI|nr:NADH dehydrogenase subunit 3 [Bothrogonia tongmaiana]QLI54093.1 NADH dehydrogenase subunit 3 [Bothrogonia tongmaiana]